MYDLLITGGTVVDGTGNPGYRAAVAVTSNRVQILRGRRAAEVDAAQVIDAAGLVVAPGFIDLHSHSALVLQDDPQHLPKITQGVTTEVIGVDGISYAPVKTTGQLRELAHSYAGLDGYPDLAYDWTSVAGLLRKYDRKIAVNVALLIGNSPLRLSTVGWEDREATSRELADMRAMLREGMQEGAFGISTGLDYAPGDFASTEELCSLAAEAGEWGGFYHTHLRSTLGDRFLDPIREAITICRKGGLPLHLTHLFHRVGSPGGAQRIFDLMDEAKSGGCEVTFDSYPYEWGSTTAAAQLPSWVFSAGPALAMDWMQDPTVRNRIREDLEHYPGYEAWRRTLDHVRLGNFSTAEFSRYEAKTLGEVARARAADPVDVICDMLVAENLRVNQVTPGPWAVTLSRFIVHPEGMVGTDSIFLGEKPSPRTYGAYPRILGDIVREEKLLSLPEAIRKMTSYPAQRLGILDRGILRDGMKADITIFDFEEIRPVGTYDWPRRQAAGVRHVVVNGELVLKDGVPTGELPGLSLRSH